MKTNTVVPYAVRRTKDHILRFTDLWHMLMNGSVVETYLESLENTDNIFPNIDYRIYAD